MESVQVTARASIAAEPGLGAHPVHPEVAAGPLVVGLDGREHDADVLALARTLQARFGAEVLIAHVIPPPPVAHSSVDYPLVARRSGRELLARAAAAPGLHGETRLLETWPASLALAQLAESQHASAIVVASSHRGMIGRVMPGRTATRLTARTPCPVAVAPRGYARAAAAAIPGVGVAYDGSQAADVALAAAIAAAGKLAVPLRLYYVIHAVSKDPSWDLFRKNIRRVAQEVLDRGLQQVPPDVVASATLLEGDVADVLGEASAHEPIGLLYAGSRGYGPLREALVSGVLGRLLSRARCPLVIVPGGDGTERTASS